VKLSSSLRLQPIKEDSATTYFVLPDFWLIAATVNKVVSQRTRTHCHLVNMKERQLRRDQISDINAPFNNVYTIQPVVYNRLYESTRLIPATQHQTHHPTVHVMYRNIQVVTCIRLQYRERGKPKLQGSSILVYHPRHIFVVNTPDFLVTR